MPQLEQLESYEEATNIERFEWLREQILLLRQDLNTHSHDLQGRPTKPLGQ